MTTKSKKRTIDAEPLPHEGLARLPAVLRAVGFSRSTWLKLVRQGHAPAPVRLGPSGHLTAWHASEIRSWIARQERVVSRIEDQRTLRYPFSKRALKREEVCDGAA